MKRVITLFAVLLMGWSVNAWSFACKTANGTAIPIGGGSANVYVNLAPAVNVGQNLVVDLSTQIFCHNDYPETITDYVTLQRVKRRTKNAKTFHDKCEKFNFRASNETAALTAVFLFIKWDHFG